MYTNLFRSKKAATIFVATDTAVSSSFSLATAIIFFSRVSAREGNVVGWMRSMAGSREENRTVATHHDLSGNFGWRLDIH
jgi:hypothetical protein